MPHEKEMEHTTPRWMDSPWFARPDTSAERSPVTERGIGQAEKLPWGFVDSTDSMKNGLIICILYIYIYYVYYIYIVCILYYVYIYIMYINIYILCI